MRPSIAARRIVWTLAATAAKPFLSNSGGPSFPRPCLAVRAESALETFF